MLRQKYGAGTHYHPIYAVINIYTVHNTSYMINTERMFN